MVEKKTKPAPKIIIETMLAAGMTQTEAAEHFNVSTRWIRTLHKRYKEGGIKALEPRSKRPHTNPRALNNNLVDRILQLRQELINRGTDAGAHTIGWHLEREGINPPASTINNSSNTRKQRPGHTTTPEASSQLMDTFSIRPT